MPRWTRPYRRAEISARSKIEANCINTQYYSIVYDLIDDVKKSIEGMYSPETQDNITGVAEVRSVFKSRKFGAIAGCIVIDGIV